jgi:F420-dependent oxidoreductase-like protein
VRLNLMVEGQEDVGWADWVALAEACEDHGFDTLFRSDHYLSVEGIAGRGSLDAWTTLAGLAAVTSTVRLGTLVSPATFRHPAVLARSVVTVDHISGGRAELGMGAGWLDAEHEAFGFPFPSTRERMDRFAEQLELVRRQWAPEPFTFEGQHYRMVDADARPKPVQAPHPPLIVGGSGGPRSVALAARWADEYNTVYVTAERCRELKAKVAEACEREGREPLPVSLMTAFLIGEDRTELLARARRLAAWRGEDEAAAERLVDAPQEGWIVGTVDEAVRQLTELAEAGLERVMLQHLLHGDLDALQLLAERVAPQLR